jgi:uncharacterized membrane protein
MSTIDLRPAFIVAQREVRDQYRDWRIIFPIVFLTLFFPFLMNFTARQLLDFVNQYGAGLVGERLIPFLLLITGFFPISVSLVIALESFVGEKERGSIEPLLTSPLADWQLYLGKLLSSTVPPLIGSFLGMSVYIGGLVINRIPLPDAETMLQIIILTITQAVVMVSGAVVVSTQATSVRAANLLASVSAAIAGMILFRLDSPGDFALNFLFCSVAMTISWVFLSGTREPAHNPLPAGQTGAQAKLWPNLGRILRQDTRFRWFLAARIVSQFATMGAAFYSVFAVQNLGASEAEVGWMTSTLLGTAIVANVAMGWVGDRWSRKGVMEIGLGAAALGALLAWWAPSAAWFYLVFALTSVGNVAIWTIGISMSMDFGAEAERPTYIGMSNTLIAPANILAPFLGGWLAQIGGYPAAFLASAAGGILAIVVFHWQLKDERTSEPSPKDLHSTGQKEA